MYRWFTPDFVSNYEGKIALVSMYLFMESKRISIILWNGDQILFLSFWSLFIINAPRPYIYTHIYTCQPGRKTKLTTSEARRHQFFNETKIRSVHRKKLQTHRTPKTNKKKYPPLQAKVPTHEGKRISETVNQILLFFSIFISPLIFFLLAQDDWKLDEFLFL